MKLHFQLISDWNFTSNWSQIETSHSNWSQIETSHSNWSHSETSLPTDLRVKLHFHWFQSATIYPADLRVKLNVSSGLKIKIRTCLGHEVKFPFLLGHGVSILISFFTVATLFLCQITCDRALWEWKHVNSLYSMHRSDTKKFLKMLHVTPPYVRQCTTIHSPHVMQGVERYILRYCFIVGFVAPNCLCN
jgi:hypothetical protein